MIRLMCACFSSSLLLAGPHLVIPSNGSLLAGERPGIGIVSASPGEVLRVHAFRADEKIVLHAWADFVADGKGQVQVDRQAPKSGSYTGIDPRGLLWSGFPALTPAVPGGAPSLDQLKPRMSALKLERDGQIVDTGAIQIRYDDENVQYTKVEGPGIYGYFAAPKGAKVLPVVILLHGSEGGTFENAKRDAGLFAAHGYAALGLIYFAWPGTGVPQVPQAFDNLPVERIAQAREWLKRRPEADIRKIGIRGVSKGSEFALIAAAEYPWIRAVAACVPTSLVWGAFGGTAPDIKQHSGFTLHGKPLPNVPYGDYEPVSTGKITLADRHRQDRTVAGESAARAARIPVEQFSGRLLLSGGGKDAVWPSLEMSKEVADTLKTAGKGSQVETLLFPEAGHYMCGTGDSPARSATGGGGTADATWQASAIVWERTLKFFRETL